MDDGRGVAEEQEAAVAVGVVELRAELLEDVEMDFEGLAVVHVGEVAAAPPEGLAAGNRLQPGGVDAAVLEEPGVLLGPILADGADHSHRREESGGIGEVDGRAAEDVVALVRGGLDAIKGDASDDEQGHGGLRGRWWIDRRRGNSEGEGR